MRNDERVNSHNHYILQLWRENIDWQPVLSAHAIIRYIAKYASKAEKSSETYHQMLMRLANIENLEDFSSKVYKKQSLKEMLVLRKHVTCSLNFLWLNAVDALLTLMFHVKYLNLLTKIMRMALKERKNHL